jgi:hypothetical protein
VAVKARTNEAPMLELVDERCETQRVATVSL